MVIRIGLPKGNYNKNRKVTYRGHVAELLEIAHFRMHNYAPGREGKGDNDEIVPITAEGEPDLEFYCMKPKEFPKLLGNDSLDLVVVGEDTALEFHARHWEDFKNVPEYSPVRFLTSLTNDPSVRIKPDFSRVDHLHRLVNLGLGRVSIHWEDSGKASRINSILEQYHNGKNPTIKIASDYPWLTYAALCEYVNPKAIIMMDGSNAAITQKEINEQQAGRGRYSSLPKVHSIFEIHPMGSNLEQILKLGFADLIVDSVASGKSRDAHGLVSVGEPILENSTAGLYCSDHISACFVATRTFEEEVAKAKEVLGMLLFTDDEKPSDEAAIKFSRETAEETIRECNSPKMVKIREIAQRLKDASHEYALQYNDSIWYPNGRPAEAV